MFNCARLKATTSIGVLGLLLAACGSSGSSAVTSTTSAAANGGPSATSNISTPTKLAFTAQGTPNLTGVTIKMGDSAGDPSVGDTVVYLTSQILKKWGATTSLILANGNNTELAVKSGQLDSTTATIGEAVNAGLKVFSPSQNHVDMILMSKTDTSISQLNGQTIGVSNAVAPDNYLNKALVKKYSLTKAAVKLTGGSSNTTALVARGAVGAGWVHSDAQIKLQKSGKFNVLVVGSKLAPFFADSYIAASPTWLAQNPAYAEALDLAWIEAANTFNSNKSAWVTAAQAYVHGAVTPTAAGAIYSAFKVANPWSVANKAHFTSSDLAQNFTVLKAAGAVSTPVTSQSQWVTFSPWNAAWSVYQAHTSAYSGS